MSEHYLHSFSRLLDGFVGEVRHKQTVSPQEIVDRVDAGFAALSAARMDNAQLIALLTIAIDRLAIQQGVVQ